MACAGQALKTCSLQPRRIMNKTFVWSPWLWNMRHDLLLGVAAPQRPTGEPERASSRWRECSNAGSTGLTPIIAWLGRLFISFASGRSANGDSMQELRAPAYLNRFV
eukprot:2221766-Amphidinium_carterae.1